MSREIKFRAWDRNVGWRIIDLTNSRGFSREVLEQMASEREVWTHDTELMQYTGLKDKNGVEIYEGDFLRSAEDDNVYQVLDILPQTRSKMVEREGVFIDGKFHHSPQAVFNDDYMSWPEMYEVIGNIYENPELLNETT